MKFGNQGNKLKTLYQTDKHGSKLLELDFTKKIIK